MSTDTRSAFVTRFDRIWTQARRVQLWQSLCWGVLTALGGIALLAAVDYLLELPHLLRIVAMGAIGVASIAVVTMLSVQSVRRWRRTATAAAIEQVFPQLGQRIRTTVQYGPLSSDQRGEAGVATNLVTALEDDTVRRAQPLPLDAVIPWKSLAVASLLAAVVGLGLAGASALNWEWRAAAQRAFLGNEPYTKITVTPGNLTVKEGESASVEVVIEGRTGKQITFLTRQAGEEGSEWETEPLATEDAEPAGERGLKFNVPLQRIMHPLEYRISAGGNSSETYKVQVLYPLKIVKIQSAVQAPEYTGLPEAVTESGNVTGLVGSHLKLQFELDRGAESAWLELEPMNRRAADKTPATKMPLTIDGNKLVVSLPIAADQTYTVVAKAADGMELPENKFRIRARQDEAPQVWFESPAEALEVHTLAEVLMRIRVSDDFGLTKAGIMFEVNNEEEYPLMAKDFLEAAEELKKTGKLSPETRASLEKVLPLEHFELAQTDSVMYYAFAEDNKPDIAQRTQTDLRFIDIRPFKRTYRILDADGMPAEQQGPPLKSLEELIARQRYALNRTIQIARRFTHTQTADLSGVDALIKFEAELAKSTRELAEGLQARGIDDTELLYQAETAMLGATDSLSAGKYDTATLQQRDALKNLIEGRNRIQMSIQKNPNRQQLAQLRAFDRIQQQKLRRPKSDEEEAKEVARRLEELADREEFVYKTLGGEDGSAKGDDAPGKSMGETKEPMKGEPKKDEEKDPGDKTGEKPGEAKTGEKNPGNKSEEKGPLTAQELEDKQLDIALEAREIEKTLGELKGITDLAKERIAGAAKSAEETSAALGKGDLAEAKQGAEAAGKQFRELSQQVQALLAEEQTQRIAAAEQMASQLAREQRDFADRLASETEGSSGEGKPKKNEEKKPGKGEVEKKDGDKNKMPGLGDQAEDIAEKAKTLADVLGAAAKANTPEDQASAKKVEELVDKLKLDELTQRLQDLPGQVGAGKMQEAKAAAGDGSERMEAAAEQLSVLHRSIVAPKVDELAKLEAKLNGLDDELQQLDTPTEITGWHMDATALLEELEKAGVTEELRKEFLEEMKKAGWGPEMKKGWNWSRVEGGYYAPPAGYRILIARLLDATRGRIQDLMLGELASSRDEAIPPQYQDLVDRYHQVLSSEGKQRKKAEPKGATKE